MTWNQKNSLVIISVLLVLAAVLIFGRQAESQNLCGNSCLSSADCMKGCVCMDDEGDGLGVCVSFN